MHETGNRADPKIKVVEVYPSDVAPTHGHKNVIQGVIRALTNHVAAESNGTKSLRFDLGTQCGSRYLDILTLRLPRPASAYESTCPRDPLFSDVRRELEEPPGIRNFILFASTIDCTGAAGYAQWPIDGRPGPENSANQGGYMAVTFYDDVHTALHEIGHNLGAVQLLSPHSDGGGHCWDLDDTMCYPYTEFLPRSPLRPCEFEDPPPWDCGKDDYFNPAPAPGSYLSSNWNTFNSVFMCRIDACAPLTFGWIPGDPQAGTPVTFTSPDAQADPGIQAEWVFGDGAPPASGAQVSHVYAAGGTYDVTLRLSNADSSSTATRTVGVRPPPAPAPAERTTNRKDGSLRPSGKKDQRGGARVKSRGRCRKRGAGTRHPASRGKARKCRAKRRAPSRGR